ncbi:MAG: recombinase family protein [Deltaproteobacteria bacterium]|nr:recombinase family protein [Deltaproteobacteria bacterium]
MKAIGYVRVSTAGQVEDGVSLDAQGAKIAAWAELNGYELASVHVDAGLSGSRADNRPALCAALDEACRQKAALVVYSLSRLARSTRDAITMSERLDRAGADLVSLSERIDTTTAAGKMVFRMLAVLAEFERDQIAERTSTAMRFKASRGEFIGGAVPYGFDLAEDRVHLVERPAEQKVIAEARRLRGAGLSLRGVAAELAGQGFHSRTGRVFQAVQVRSMLAG